VNKLRTCAQPGGCKTLFRWQGRRWCLWQGMHPLESCHIRFCMFHSRESSLLLASGKHERGDLLRTCYFRFIHTCRSSTDGNVSCLVAITGHLGCPKQFKIPPQLATQILPFALYISPLSVQALQRTSCLSYVSYATTAA
jgi:hypothetical protein